MCFDAEGYCDRAEAVLRTCHYLQCRPHLTSIKLLPPKPSIQGILYWKDTIKFRDGHLLNVTDHVAFGLRKTPDKHNFSYDFRRTCGELVFRYCTHGRSIILGRDACHVHVGREDRIIEYADGRAWLRSVDFCTAITTICSYFEGKPLPWEAE